MYLEHFSLRDFPFALTPDTSYFMNRAGYQDALNVLLVALRSGEGFVKVTGEVGIGKTLLCRKLLKTLGDDFVSAYIFNPCLEPASLLLALADELAVTYDEGISQHTLIKRIAKALLDHYRDKKHVVLCLDEVQAMPVETLETLRLLTNLETERRKLLQVVLFGQPELDRLLEQPSVRQLRQRITFSYRLLPLNRVALVAYVRHRLAVAGYRGKGLFTKRALHLLYSGSEGIPRLINILCHKSMMLSYGKGDLIVDRNHMRVALEDTVEAQRIERPWFITWLPTFSRWLYG
ncbi:MAG: AAA family ATPase [Gammaproteobacteria bacterium]|nr:AAA family ATPase [Gammaproteobacteria bacterium]MCI0590116.1 AAA family ATPase [Gammaproteobacteria bacterium]